MSRYVTCAVHSAPTKSPAVVTRQSEARLPTAHGTFTVYAYAASPDDRTPTLALVAEGTDFSKPVLTRLHSECITGDVFHSLRCDCGAQLDRALELTGDEGGVVLYLRQEGRGIGIINKLDAYQLQDAGADTVEANQRLGLPVDGRDYTGAIAVLQDLGVRSVRLLTNNPDKEAAFAKTGIAVTERVPIEIEKQPESERYLNTKRDAMGHQIS